MVPMMDVDNVAEGAFGKDQYPIDFNRSWLGHSTWNAIHAVKRLSMRYSIAMAFDFHAPYPISRGGLITTMSLKPVVKIMSD